MKQFTVTLVIQDDLGDSVVQRTINAETYASAETKIRELYGWSAKILNITCAETQQNLLLG